MLRSTDQCGSSPPSCCTYPMPRRSATGSNDSTGRPPTSTTPASGLTMALKQRSSVVFPDPLSPTSAAHEPRVTSSETPSSAVVGPYRLTTLRTRRAGGPPLTVTRRTPQGQDPTRPSLCVRAVQPHLMLRCRFKGATRFSPKSRGVDPITRISGDRVWVVWLQGIPEPRRPRVEGTRLPGSAAPW